MKPGAPVEEPPRLLRDGVTSPDKLFPGGSLSNGACFDSFSQTGLPAEALHQPDHQLLLEISAGVEAGPDSISTGP